MKYELKLMQPIFEILNDHKEIFENHWETRSETYETLKEEDIQKELMYTKQKLNELKNYINAIKENKRSKKCLFFFKDYVELLLKYHEKDIDMYPGTYMYHYNELLLGAQRYLNIKKELRELG